MSRSSDRPASHRFDDGSNAVVIEGPLFVQCRRGKLTVDAYRPALYTMIAILAVGFIANLLIRPVASRYWEKADADVPEGTTPTERETV